MGVRLPISFDKAAFFVLWIASCSCTYIYIVLSNYTYIIYHIYYIWDMCRYIYIYTHTPLFSASHVTKHKFKVASYSYLSVFIPLFPRLIHMLLQNWGSFVLGSHGCLLSDGAGCRETTVSFKVFLKCLGVLSCRSKMTMIEPVDMEVSNDYQFWKRWVLEDTSRVRLPWEEVQVFFEGIAAGFFRSIRPTLWLWSWKKSLCSKTWKQTPT